MAFLNCNLPSRLTIRRLLSPAIFLSVALLAASSFADPILTAVSSFHGTNGAQPFGTLLRATNGLFYGTTARGGDFDQGVVFTATSSGNIQSLASLNETNGSQPLVGLAQGLDGLLYGTASSGGDFDLGTIFSVTTDGILTNLFSFDSTNGARPLSPLLVGIDGNFYGTASLGGALNLGTIFLLSPTGAVVSLFSFAGTNGAQPGGSLAQTSDGTIFGTTSAGGAFGYGTVFSWSPVAGLITLKSFSGPADGAGPQGGLIMATDGNLYGTTAAGGTNNAGSGGNGTIFQISPAGAFATVHVFATGEGANSSGPLFQVGNNVFYGTSASGGTRGLGTIFTFAVGRGFTNLDSLISSQGTSPHAGFAAGTNGNLFSVASSGGRYGMGTLFQLSGLSPFIITAPTNKTVETGDTVSFSVLAGGSAPFKFQWQFNSNNVVNSKVISGSTSSTLTLASVTPANSGFYTVVVQNSAGQVLSASAQLSVIPIPSIRITSPSRNAVVKGQQITVSGTAGGNAVVTRVYYQVNDTGWQLATTSDNWAHWKAPVQLDLGTNEVDAFAESVIGTYSSTNTILVFAPPFVPIQGTYNGLFAALEAFAPESSGFITLNLSFKGTFSGRIQMAAARYSFSGHFDTDGNATVIIPRSGKTPLTLSLHLDLPSANNQVTGTITDNSWIAELLANRTIFDSRTNPAPQQGRYTFNLPGSPDPTVAPAGDSFGTLTVSSSGRITAAVSLADNTRFTQSISLANDGTWPFFAQLYGGKGVILGWMSFTNPPRSVLGGEINWYKPPQPSAKYYPDGFTLLATASGGSYAPPGQGTNLFNADNLDLIFAGADISETNQISLDLHNHVADLSGNRLSFSFTPSTGAFHGSLTDSATARKLPFSGVIRQDIGIGDGFFLGTNTTGLLLLQPQFQVGGQNESKR